MGENLHAATSGIALESVLITWALNRAWEMLLYGFMFLIDIHWCFTPCEMVTVLFVYTLVII